MYFPPLFSLVAPFIFHFFNSQQTTDEHRSHLQHIKFAVSMDIYIYIYKWNTEFYECAHIGKRRNSLQQETISCPYIYVQAPSSLHSIHIYTRIFVIKEYKKKYITQHNVTGSWERIIVPLVNKVLSLVLDRSVTSEGNYFLLRLLLLLFFIFSIHLPTCIFYVIDRFLILIIQQNAQQK